MGFRTFINNWKRRKLEKDMERKRLNDLFEKFLIETRPLAPKASKYPEAALLRHAWKRAAILSYLFKDIPNSENGYLYNNFAEIAAKRYYHIAPENVYGKVLLKIEPNAAQRLLEKEKELLFPKKIVSVVSRELACIYIGVDDNGKCYIGQTIDAPEFRWVQHRAANTGPFKSGANYVKWKILERNVSPSDLNKIESYYIGFYNAVVEGYNDTRGNDLAAYERGLNERHARRLQNQVKVNRL